MSQEDRRTKAATSEESLYNVKDVKAFIETERRKDMLDRMREVQDQKRVWRKTVLFCGALNLALIALAISGVLWP